MQLFDNRSLMVFLLCLLAIGTNAKGKKGFDYSIQSVPEESGIRFEKISDDADFVYSDGLVGRDASSWWVGPQLAISPDGNRIAYINNRNKMQNIMIKPTTKGGASVQRTSRVHVLDVYWSKDGNTLCFTEYRNDHYGIYLTDADKGFIVRQINNGKDNDFSGVVTGQHVLFHRQEGRNNYGLWDYNIETNMFSNFTSGLNPIPDPNKIGTIYCVRLSNGSRGEIWRINYETGVEELILSDPEKSFTTPQLSPDGQWLLCTGNSISELTKQRNTDIYAIRVDGTQLTQLTYHPGNDISAIWSPGGTSIYFLSQRGSYDKVYNIWRMDFTLF